MWQKEQDRLQEEAQKRKEAETSLFDKVPGTRAAITAASPAVSFLGGKFLGRRMSPWASVPIGGTAGAIEGAASIAGPTEMDINSLPRTSPTRQEAEADLDRKSYWQRVGLAAGVSGAAGMLGATKGYASTRPILSRAALPDAAEKAVEIAKQPAKKATVKPTVVKLPDGSTVHKFDYGNRVMWRDPTTKKLVKAPNTNQLPAPTSAPPAQIQATGGRVNPFARGGEVDWGDGTPTEGWGAGDNPDWSDVVERQNSAGDPQRRMDEWGANYRRPTIGKFPASPSPNPPVAPDLGYEHAAFKPTQEVYGRKLSGDMVGYAPADDVDRVQAGHDGEEQGVELPSRKAAPDVNPYDARAEDTSAKPQAKAGKQSFIDSPWMALVNAGLGTLAAAGQRDARGLPMSPAAAIGHGGQQGIKTLQEQQAAGLKRMTVEQRAKQLEAEAARHLRQMGETERHNKAIEGHQKELTDIQKSRYGTGLFDPETVTMMAHQAMQGDKSVFANLGRGVSGPQNIVSVRNEMNRLAKERGYSGADIAALNANFSAQSAAARSAAVREANISTAVEEAKGTFPLALHASEQLPRTDFVPINKMIQAWRSGTSTPAQAQFAIAHQGVITAYSQAMSRTGVNTVHAQQRAEDAFSQVQNHPSYQAAIEQLEKEMDIAKRAPETARQMILDRISGKKTEEKPAAAPSSTTKLTPQKRQEALDWAKSNPSDPRAARIIKEFGGP